MKNKILIPITLLFNLLFGQIEIDPDNIDFGGQTVGTTSVPPSGHLQIAQTVTLTGQSAPYSIVPESVALDANESAKCDYLFLSQCYRKLFPELTWLVAYSDPFF